MERIFLIKDHNFEQKVSINIIDFEWRKLVVFVRVKMQMQINGLVNVKYRWMD